LMLLNAVYFKGAWKEKFDKEWTEPNHEKFQIPMMATFGYFPIFEDNEVQVLAMPYEGDKNMNMYIFLPRNRFGLEDFERSLNGSKMMHYFQNCKASKESYVSH
uniref:SERPIN domain-containing protein n=1 Tax=Gongylonema pulchrum TaxID=637853 RepID=A0A183DLM1_9BILA